MIHEVEEYYKPISVWNDLNEKFPLARFTKA